MSQLKGNRYQQSLFPASIEDYVSAGDPVRVYDAFVDGLNLSELGFVIKENRKGAPNYDVSSMVKLLVYSYSYGWRSSRKIERALHHNLSFIWLTGGLKPDHKTIANFRKNNLQPISKLLKQCVRFCIKIDLIDGNCLFIDGSKFRANASKNKVSSIKGMEKYLDKIDRKIEELLTQVEQIDHQENTTQNSEEVTQKVKKLCKNKNKIQALIKELKEEGFPENKKYNTTDPESELMKSRQGIHSALNVQVSTDDKNGLIVHADATSDQTDTKQLKIQSNNADENLEGKSAIICADAGYSNNEVAEELSKEKQIIRPSNQQASKKEISPFDKRNFKYNSEQDIYICPTGETLYKSSYNTSKKAYKYRIKGNPCKNCKHFGACTTDKRQGREINRLKHQEVADQLEADYLQPQNQEIYTRRQHLAESPFGHIKHNLRAGYFLLRGRKGANTEMSLLSTAYNITRMINILGGSKELIALLQKQ